MPLDELAAYACGDTTLAYLLDRRTGRVGMTLYPTAMAGRRVRRRETLAGLPFIDSIPGAGGIRAAELDPLVHLKLVGDPYSGAFAQGRTMRNAPSVDRFRYRRQEVSRESAATRVLTVLESAEGLQLEHTVAWQAGDHVAAVSTRFVNGSDEPVTLELLTSFSLGGVTPFHPADAPGRLRVHRFRSGWSAEGRHVTETLESLHLERSWSGAGLFAERFGQVGSMPVRGWFPFVAVEDVEAGVLWGATLAWAGSWQLEIARQHDEVCLSGGLADREFGHWMCTLAPGDSVTTPAATVGCVQGDVDDLCDRLTAPMARAADAHPAVEHALPIIYNEFCATWGNPRHDHLVRLADTLKGSGVRYLVIDAGWYQGRSGNWDSAQGDWEPSPRLFPKGLAATADAIRDRGLIPGLWFEFEVVGKDSAAFGMAAHHLHRDGLPITVRGRRFWNLNDPAVIDYLSTRVIGLLERCGFGYLKIDYNETLGIGCEDGAPRSLGEGLRLQTEGLYRFLDRIRARLPGLVIESCSSGGHRLEPSLLARTAMSSFSDAHELPEIPIIAANLHRLLLPRQLQVWAVLRPTDAERRLTYSLAATFLGRMTLSGDVDRLSSRQRVAVDAAISLYRRAAPVIKEGVSRRFGAWGESWRYPRGWQAVRRVNAAGTMAVVVVHGFAGAPAEVTVPLLAGGGWRVDGVLGGGGMRVDGATLDCGLGDFCGMVALLSRDLPATDV
jgi:alpha-galactosidase